MVHNNKVLTVSYGTFSCTLEGFDDSFGTMKAIAEYFRDLASDDRYFGAEPPQPDAEMLARIAQREITRQVEAHSTSTGAIVLRATELAAAPVEAPAQEAKQEPIAEVAPEATEEQGQKPDGVVSEEAEALPVEADVEADEVAEADPVVAEVADPVVAEVADPAVTEPETIAGDAGAKAEAEIAQSAVTPQDEVTVDSVTDALKEEDTPADVPQEVATPDMVENAPESDVAPEAGETAEPQPVKVHEEAVAEDVQEPEAVPAADSIAAKLQRIRAVVSQNDAFAGSGEYTEDEEYAGTETPDIAEVLKSDVDAVSARNVQDQDAQANDIAGQLDSIEAPADDAADNAQDSPVADVDEEFFARQDRDDDAELFDDPDFDEAGETEQDPAQAPVQARVIKVKSADLDIAIATGQLEQIGADIPAPQEDSALSPEDEADLMRELAEVEGDLAKDQDAPEAADNIFGHDIASEIASDSDDEQERDEAAHAVLSHAVGDDEGDLSRLMEAADQKLDDPENSTRRETYSQLRGAVAAAEAEKSAGGSVDGQAKDDDYRDDLASVVRPRRPAIEGDRPSSRRVTDNKPAPLKLVAEQRIDQGTGLSQNGPVRPRRVMTVPAQPASASGTISADSAFADFATRVGATELPELLEAAAAYLSFVEGQDQFSRPQLMNKVRLVKQDDFNREDGLRSFGQLLRDGKIEKRGGGRFSASVEIGFRPDEREAG